MATSYYRERERGKCVETFGGEDSVDRERSTKVCGIVVSKVDYFWGEGADYCQEM